jgi:hypothetical protein
LPALQRQRTSHFFDEKATVGRPNSNLVGLGPSCFFFIGHRKVVGFAKAF